MAKLPPPHDPTILAMYAAIESQPQKARAYLGMSQIGACCERSLWYSFRWAVAPNFPASTLFKFADGHLSEAITAERLRLVPGVSLSTHDSNGNQFGFTDHGGHFSGHVDGIIHGLLHAPKTHAIWEHKCVNEEKFRKLNKLKDELGEKNALKEWDEVYYGQAMAYCHYSGLDRHYLTVSTAGSRETTSCYTEADPSHAAMLVERAGRIVNAVEPEPRISEDPSFYQCKWCDFHGVCHMGDLPEVNCRTCMHSTPVVDATQEAKWHCALADCHIPVDEARKAHPCHRYLPFMIPWAKAIDVVNEVDIAYETEDGRRFVNGQSEGAYSSGELRNADRNLVGDLTVEELRLKMDAQFVHAEAEMEFSDEEIPF